MTTSESWRGQIADLLGDVDTRIVQAVEAGAQKPGLDYIVHASGKRMRPALTLLCAQMIGAATPTTVEAAAGVEFIHVATLIHDDVIDQSSTRRGRPSLVASDGMGTAIVVGDYYLTAGLQLLNRCGDAGLVQRACEAVMRICTGELTQVRLDDVASAEQNYLDKVEAKTAELLRVGALAGTVGGGNDEQRTALDEFARCLGISFQIVDDLLDYEADAAALGKPAGADFAAGTITLPLLRALNEGDDISAELRDVTARGDVARVVQLVRRSPALDSVRETATEYADRAKRQLEIFADGEAKSGLLGFADFVLARRA